MDDIQSTAKFYNKVINDRSKELTKLKKKIFQISCFRLVIFVLCILGVYIFWGNVGYVSITIGLAVIIFLGFMKYHSNLFKAKTYCQLIIVNAQNELKGLNYDFSAFDSGSEYIDAEHSFSLDLDLFGEKSFFQSINRTVTSFGKSALSDTFICPLKNKKEILLRQEAIKELAEKKELILHFRTSGNMSKMAPISKTFIKTKAILMNSSLWNSIIYLVPSIYIACIVLVNFEFIGGTIFLPLYLITFAISALAGKKVGEIKDVFEQKSDIFDTYSQLLKIIEKEKFKSPLLHNIQQQIVNPQNASTAISKLRGLNNNLEMAYAYPILLLLNPVLIWNVRSAIRIEKWSEKYSQYTDNWFSAMAQFDSLISLATFAFNHPGYTFPKPTDTFTFKGEEMGHPLIDRDLCVRNDIDIHTTPYFLIITGANMAGKSTYLRTIGINHLLACIGAPVCAKSLEFYPNQLVTNLRTSDSLAENESYFFAELKRLKVIIDRLTAGEEIFIILDEILKGTNSEDKRKGSIALMHQLLALKGNGIIATHDLELGLLESDYPDFVKNLCFEADITNDNLSFTYKIREGVAKNMNATFLMKKMGITGL